MTDEVDKFAKLKSEFGRDQRPATVVIGVWLAVGTALGQPYPCRCVEGGARRWKCAAPPSGWPENVCPCRGRTDLAGLPFDCCAIQASIRAATQQTSARLSV